MTAPASSGFPATDPRVQRWRHDLHRCPETAFEEHLTSNYLSAVFDDLGLEVTRGIGGTGLVASLTRGTSGRTIGFRTDIDCLPLQEDSRHDVVSEHPGRMHACGHDGHMAMVLGAAAALAEDPAFGGTVRFICQPAEEPGRGAQAMIDDGLFERFPIDELHGLHNIPGLPAGHLHTRPGAVMASEDNFEIVITGRGGHASAPAAIIDPIVIGAQIVTALQTIVARSVDPQHSAVLSCTDFRTDGARNAIPSEVRITGDTRSFDIADQALLEQRIRDISHGVAAAHGATSEVTYTHEFGPTINDADAVAHAVAAAESALGADRVHQDCAPIMASEDFGVFAHHVPACFAFIGNGIGEGGTPLHSRDYTFNDAALGAGVAYYVSLARRSV